MVRRLLFIVLLWLGTDLYFFQAFKTAINAPAIQWLYWALDIVLIAGMVIAILARNRPAVREKFFGFITGAMLVVFIPRLVAIPVLLLEDGTRLFRGFPPRLLWVSVIALGICGVMTLVVLFGIMRGGHYYKVKRETIFFPDLPEAFDGFTITQISDVHSGSFTSAAGVQKGIDMVNAQKSDVILFTGDLVNARASEMERWVSVFAQLKAPMGKFSILGNHDYGDYAEWKDAATKATNLRRLKEIHKEMGFRLLLDESLRLTKGDQSIALIGVENWGKGNFHQYGDLKKATQNVAPNEFKVLMSHDPSHWEAVTLKHHQHIHLTLSGHTHGMQFGIDFLGIRWSPIQYVYKQWFGLYQNTGRYLYVNRGFGFLGLKGRIGMWPEITVITLKLQV